MLFDESNNFVALKLRKAVSVFVSAVFFVSVLLQGADVKAATLSELSDADVYFKQNTSYTCTLASCAMVMKRTAYLLNDDDTDDIDEDSIKSDAWINGVGLRWDFSSFGMHITHDYLSSDYNSDEKALYFRLLLNKYPQGVVAYNNGNSSQSHAIVITDYDKSSGSFYASDPAAGAPEGRIKLEDTSIKGSTQSEKLDNIGAYWTVSSPSVSIEPDDGFSKTQVNDFFSYCASRKEVNSYFLANPFTSSKINIRSLPDTSSDIKRKVDPKTYLYLVSSGKNSKGEIWYQVKNGGYIRSDVVTSLSNYSPDIKSFKKTSEPVGIVYKAEANVRLRLIPSEGNSQVGLIGKGKKIYISEKGENSAGSEWLKTEDGYYLKSKYFTPYSIYKSAADAEYTASVATGVYSASPEADSGKKDNNLIVNSGIKYTITASSLYLREKPVDGAPVNLLYSGEVVYVTKIRDNWGCAVSDGIAGWFSLDYAETDEEKENTTAKIKETTTAAAETTTVKIPKKTTENIFTTKLMTTKSVTTSSAATKADETTNNSVKMGDVDFDGKVTALDARIVLRISSRIYLPNSKQMKAADVNGDGRVNSIDARYILLKSANLKNSFD